LLVLTVTEGFEAGSVGFLLRLEWQILRGQFRWDDRLCKFDIQGKIG
jgi:hypothetical protein